MDLKGKEEILKAIKKRDQITMRLMQRQLDSTIKGFSVQLAQFEERNARQHNDIVKHQKETNGRVLSLENETRIFRWASNNPKIAVGIVILLFVGIAAVKEFSVFSNLISIMP